MKYIYIFTAFCLWGSFATAESYKQCEPNAEKYKEIMNDRENCADEDTENAISLYKVLAEIAACEDYNIEKIAVVELFKTRSLKKEPDCTVKVKKASASIGGGEIEIKSAEGIKKIRWDGKHDLTNKNNTVKFWRDQLVPQAIEALSNK